MQKLKIKNKIEFTFRLQSAATAASNRRGEPQIFPVDDSHRNSSRIATEIRRGEPPRIDDDSHRYYLSQRVTEILPRREPPTLRHRREPPTRFILHAISSFLSRREKEQKDKRFSFSFVSKHVSSHHSTRVPQESDLSTFN